jgi:hypothetical protein
MGCCSDGSAKPYNFSTASAQAATCPPPIVGTLLSHVAWQQRMDKTRCSRRTHWISSGLVAGLALVSTPPAKAGYPGLGAYIGGATGQGWVETGDRTLSGTSIPAFRENHIAYELMAGVRPISLFGAEIAYVDFGHPHQTRPVGDAVSAGLSLSAADVRMKGAAAFGILYLPVRVVDVYVKAGLSRIQTTANVAGVRLGVASCAFNAPNCALFTAHGSTTDTHVAVGAGAQLKLGSWALRAEYERFDAAGGNPGLATVGVTWTFL